METKSAVIADTDSDLILKSTSYFLNSDNLLFPPVFGDGKASERIAKICDDFLSNKH